jgi:galactitol-specific phosphotransferase system IIB component
MKKLLVIYLLSLMACNNYKAAKSIDITVCYNNFKKSYKIDENGKVLYLKRTINSNDSLFETSLTQNEYDNLRHTFENVSNKKCDSTKNFYVDGTNYKIIITNKSSEKIVLLSNNCLNYKELDQTIFSFVKKIEKKKKFTVFESVEKELIYQPR